MGTGSASLHSYKMCPSIVCLPLLSLTAAQVSTIAALGVLAKLGGLGAGLALSRRGRRQADKEEITLEMLTNIEPDDCYKRVICAATTGKVDNQKMRNILKFFSE